MAKNNKNNNLDPDAIASGKNSVSGADKSKNQGHTEYYKLVSGVASNFDSEPQSEKPQFDDYFEFNYRGGVLITNKIVDCMQCVHCDKDGKCPLELAMMLCDMGNLWGGMEILIWYATAKPKCQLAEDLINFFLDDTIFTGKVLGVHQFAVAFIWMGYGVPLGKVKPLLTKAAKNGNVDAKDLLKKLK